MSELDELTYTIGVDLGTTHCAVAAVGINARANAPASATHMTLRALSLEMDIFITTSLYGCHHPIQS